MGWGVKEVCHYAASGETGVGGAGGHHGVGAVVAEGGREPDVDHRQLGDGGAGLGLLCCGHVEDLTKLQNVLQSAWPLNSPNLSGLVLDFRRFLTIAILLHRIA